MKTKNHKSQKHKVKEQIKNTLVIKQTKKEKEKKEKKI